MSEIKLPEHRPGASTSEFKLTLAMFVVGVGLSIYGTLKGNDALVQLGAALVAISGGSYSISRGIAKVGK